MDQTLVLGFEEAFKNHVQRVTQNQSKNSGFLFLEYIEKFINNDDQTLEYLKKYDNLYRFVKFSATMLAQAKIETQVVTDQNFISVVNSWPAFQAKNNSLNFTNDKMISFINQIYNFSYQQETPVSFLIRYLAIFYEQNLINLIQQRLQTLFPIDMNMQIAYLVTFIDQVIGSATTVNFQNNPNQLYSYHFLLLPIFIYGQGLGQLTFAQQLVTFATYINQRDNIPYNVFWNPDLAYIITFIHENLYGINQQSNQNRTIFLYLLSRHLAILNLNEQLNAISEMPQNEYFSTKQVSGDIIKELSQNLAKAQFYAQTFMQNADKQLQYDLYLNYIDSLKTQEEKLMTQNFYSVLNRLSEIIFSATRQNFIFYQFEFFPLLYILCLNKLYYYELQDNQRERLLEYLKSRENESRSITHRVYYSDIHLTIVLANFIISSVKSTYEVSIVPFYDLLFLYHDPSEFSSDSVMNQETDFDKKSETFIQQLSLYLNSFQNLTLKQITKNLKYYVYIQQYDYIGNQIEDFTDKANIEIAENEKLNNQQQNVLPQLEQIVTSETDDFKKYNITRIKQILQNQEKQNFQYINLTDMSNVSDLVNVAFQIIVKYYLLVQDEFSLRIPILSNSNQQTLMNKLNYLTKTLYFSRQIKQYHHLAKINQPIKFYIYQLESKLALQNFIEENNIEEEQEKLNEINSKLKEDLSNLQNELRELQITQQNNTIATVTQINKILNDQDQINTRLKTIQKKLLQDFINKEEKTIIAQSIKETENYLIQYSQNFKILEDKVNYYKDNQELLKAIFAIKQDYNNFIRTDFIKGMLEQLEQISAQNVDQIKQIEDLKEIVVQVVNPLLSTSDQTTDITNEAVLSTVLSGVLNTVVPSVNIEQIQFQITRGDKKIYKSSYGRAFNLAITAIANQK